VTTLRNYMINMSVPLQGAAAVETVLVLFLP